jgi:hypothetical protein
MHAGVWAAVVAAASVLGPGTGSAACPSGTAGDCVNLGLVPQITQQIVAGERIATPPPKARAAEPIPIYTGPTIGAAPNLRRAPEIGYRWSID